ncbi:glycine cleavage system aminomethyltransferase GcvT [Microbacterium sp. W1N]|uniref:glycine cleavage system aminomethyltransferase GcvT n=1 Tax=Microbacterium festucae TaxID=2977531 RepID=UPI0021C1B308|nr:glycine cleavage system aminomethyltransferase GcvT [Microbacterium festucae]MCT9820483.1 glycine cleavage system aminomethyltransferase GcvT [Microbacterium festucae]
MSETENTGAAPRQSPLHPQHEALGASFTDFGGWLMPVRYTSDLAEHHAVRGAAGLFDISHMAEFTVDGAGAGAFLDVALAGRLSALPVGKAKYSLLLSTDGGIVDDVIVYRLAEHSYLVISNAGGRAAVAAAFAERAAAHDARVVDVTDDYALIAVQGPAAQAILAGIPEITDVTVPWEQQRYYAWAGATFAGQPLLLARTGYTGEDGFELLVPVGLADALWQRVLAAGAPHGLVAAGLAARDTLRLEAGMPLYGHELSLQTTPAQAGLGRVVVADKPDFVGKAALAAAPAEARVLVALAGAGKRAARAGYAVHATADDDHAIGEVTSGALSPTLGHPIAMAYVDPAHAASGGELFVDVRGTRLPVTVTTLPFYRRTT